MASQIHDASLPSQTYFREAFTPSWKRFRRVLEALGRKVLLRAAIKLEDPAKSKFGRHSVCDVAKPRGPVAPAIRDSSRDLRQTAVAAFGKVRRIHTTGNIPAAVSYTLGWLKRRGLCFARFDEKSGVCLIRQNEYEAIKSKFLRSSEIVMVRAGELKP